MQLKYVDTYYENVVAIQNVNSHIIILSVFISNICWAVWCHYIHISMHTNAHVSVLAATKS